MPPWVHPAPSRTQPHPAAPSRTQPHPAAPSRTQPHPAAQSKTPYRGFLRPCSNVPRLIPYSVSFAIIALIMLSAAVHRYRALLCNLYQTPIEILLSAVLFIYLFISFWNRRLDAAAVKKMERYKAVNPGWAKGKETTLGSKIVNC